ncbi:hypothetical protein GCM10009839_69240 [Catenulispora yoronensis]|uniref:Uncharacterized protein n=2 Tax=Catenulispora yoronensis TaxID=450799 RepID=A0ABP5GN89_9ACTN
MEDLICAARSHGRCGDWSAEAAETAVIGDTRAVALAVLQGFFDTQQGVARLWRSPGLACFRFDCVRRGSSPIVVFGRGETVMASLVDLLAEREIAAEAWVAALQEQIAALSGQLAVAAEAVSRLRVTRETVAGVGRCVG